MRFRRIPGGRCAAVLASLAMAGAAEEPAPVGTMALEWTGDIASRLVEGVDRFLLRQIESSAVRRSEYFQVDLSSPAAYSKSLGAHREVLTRILGAGDRRVPFEGPELLANTERSSLVAAGPAFEAHAIRWPVFPGVHGEGILYRPTQPPRAAAIVVPHCDPWNDACDGDWPASDELLSGPARRLAENGVLVVVPALIDRGLVQRGNALLSNREYLYRPGFELGRHLIGHEVQKTLAVVDWLKRRFPELKLGVLGAGDGGWIGLFAAALDERIDAAALTGSFDDRLGVWAEPIDRNLFGLLEHFGGAELAALVAPRPVLVHLAPGPELELPGKGGAPARLRSPDLRAARAEVDRARALTAGLSPPPRVRAVEKGMFTAFLEDLGLKGSPLAPEQPLERRPGWNGEPAARLARQIEEIDRHQQRILAACAGTRRDLFKDLDTSSPARYAATVERYRTIFRDEVIGRFDLPALPYNARSRKAHDQPGWVGHEVVLDVFPDVFAYGILLLPKDLKPGERRPVVVCQHGLEGRPQDVVQGDNPAYHDFAARLAERGFITFAPQNLYIFGDRFRTLQRKANPLGKTLFSVIVPQHQQIVSWLKNQPFVDASRIAFYGLSYGGKSAMRIPPLVEDYCLSICSADFNEWVWKNASTVSPHSYVWSGEYEIFEWNLGHTFNYAEMAALIAPRPFMVERGHFDGVAPDETVGYEFARVRNLYAARLGLGDRTEIEWFVGPHTINGKGTFDFLHKHLAWPRR